MNEVLRWECASAAVPLENDAVHVWRASLRGGASPGALHALLSAEERQRAARFRFDRDRDDFIAARGILRILLGRYLNAAPEELLFDYNAHGKPHLREAAKHARCRFNLSHSHGLALFAFSRRRELGVDLERIRSDIEVEAIADRFFSARERHLLQALPPAERLSAFFVCWTQKEAYVKARGKGLGFGLDQFDVGLDGRERLQATRPDPQEAGRWSIRVLMLDGAHAAAVAAEGRDWQLRCWDYV